ncbi:hypothetical protein D3C81_1924470 [compost metagenome]
MPQELISVPYKATCAAAGTSTTTGPFPLPVRPDHTVRAAIGQRLHTQLGVAHSCGFFEDAAQAQALDRRLCWNQGPQIKDAGQTFRMKWPGRMSIAIEHSRSSKDQGLKT